MRLDEAPEFAWMPEQEASPALRVIQLSPGDVSDRAALRIHRALLDEGVRSRLWVDESRSGEWSVEEADQGMPRIPVRLRRILDAQIRRVFQPASPGDHTAAFLPSAWSGRINEEDADLVHLHGRVADMMSIADIGRIRKPVVWTLQDMWGFCGAEHHALDSRWQEGYLQTNRPRGEKGFDLNRWTWRRKFKHWQQPMHIVCPNHWLANRVRESALMWDWPVSVIPNAIDTDRWKPLDQAMARELLGLDPDPAMILVESTGDKDDPRSGLDLLQAALHMLNDAIPLSAPELLVFGRPTPDALRGTGLSVRHVGPLNDELSLRILHAAADLLVLPAGQNSPSSAALEALACGTPVVGFDSCGFNDIVSHEQTGYLAQPQDAEDLARGMLWVLQHETERSLSQHAREQAVELFSCPVVAAQYHALYRQVLEELQSPQRSPA